MSRLFLVVVTSLLVSGCGEHYETVHYNTPSDVAAIGPSREMTFTKTSFGDTGAKPEPFTEPVFVDEAMLFAGDVSAAMPKPPGGMLRLLRRQGARTVTCGAAIAQFEPTEDESGFRFRAAVKAPQNPGVYLVEVRTRDALLALGEITVRTRPNQ
jgi:hypothetical protein